MRMPKRRSSEMEETNKMAAEKEEKKRLVIERDSIGRNDLDEDHLEPATASPAEHSDAQMTMKFSWKLLLPQLRTENSITEQEASASSHSPTKSNPAPDAGTAPSNQSTTDKSSK